MSQNEVKTLRTQLANERQQRSDKEATTDELHEAAVVQAELALSEATATNRSLRAQIDKMQAAMVWKGEGLDKSSSTSNPSSVESIPDFFFPSPQGDLEANIEEEKAAKASAVAKQVGSLGGADCRRKAEAPNALNSSITLNIPNPGVP